MPSLDGKKKKKEFGKWTHLIFLSQLWCLKTFYNILYQEMQLLFMGKKMESFNFIKVTKIMDDLTLHSWRTKLKLKYSKLNFSVKLQFATMFFDILNLSMLYRKTFTHRILLEQMNKYWNWTTFQWKFFNFKTFRNEEAYLDPNLVEIQNISHKTFSD